MASANSIPPFPTDIDRIVFSTYISGFVDGEGSFMLRKNSLSASFAIRLRSDDIDILTLIRSFFGCGGLGVFNAYSSTRSTNTFAMYQIRKIKDLATIIVPHFETFPLRAKKKRDFAIWKQSVHLLHTLKLRPPLSMRNRSRNGPRISKITDAERKTYFQLAHLLHQQRQFQSSEFPADQAIEQEYLPLFD